MTAAVRVPPSAWSTSQSTMIWRLPSSSRRTAVRRLRPISRRISWVRACGVVSRCVRVCVLRGSIAYSPVTQPRSSLARIIQGGNCSSTVALHSTTVSPCVTSTEPSAHRV